MAKEQDDLRTLAKEVSSKALVCVKGVHVYRDCSKKFLVP